MATGEGRGKSLDEGSTGPIAVENFGVGLCPAVDVSWLKLLEWRCISDSIFEGDYDHI
jgi:hypothetical protein